jgi:phosphoribosylanthranilate isomerase
MWIKICGLTTPDAVAAALEARVDAIGFVFTESVRQLTTQRASQLAAPARRSLPCVAVMFQPQQSLVDEVLRDFRPDVLQCDAADLAALRLPKSLELLPVLRPGASVREGVPGRVLFDGSASGAGRITDWSEAQRLARQTQLILAGGLDSGNVAQAVAAVRPHGVDVSSGVEEAPGVKSPAKIAGFVAAARAAFGDR